MRLSKLKSIHATAQPNRPWLLRQRMHRRPVWRQLIQICLKIALLTATFSSKAFPQSDDIVRLDDFPNHLDPWQEIRINKTVPPNRFELRVWDSANAVEVISNASMSLLGRTIDVDLERTPLLCWRWRVDTVLKTADMAQRSGDDYAARLYVSLSLPEDEKGFFLKSQLALARTIWGHQVPDAAINYVWDNRYAQGTIRPNAYTDRTTMVVLQSGYDRIGRWVNETRHLRNDMKSLYSPRATITQIAIGSDTDNTGEATRAGFADMHFASEASGCQFPS